MPLGRPGWMGILFTHFIPCTFLGIIVMEALSEQLQRLEAMEGGPDLLHVLVGSALAGLIVAAATWFLHQLAHRKFGDRYFQSLEERRRKRRRIRGTAVGFVCGALCPLYVFVPSITPVLAVLFFVLILRYARTFLARASVILRPGSYARPVDILHLLFLYGCLIASFTVLNLSIGAIHRHLGLDSEAFRGFAEGPARVYDHLYFTVVVMTTLGFGDISPVSADAKLVVAMEVVIAYLFFALLIGTITRGILPHEDEIKNTSQEEPPEIR